VAFGWRCLCICGNGLSWLFKGLGVSAVGLVRAVKDVGAEWHFGYMCLWWCCGWLHRSVE